MICTALRLRFAYEYTLLVARVTRGPEPFHVPGNSF
jgi:hypothetical protein